MCSNPIHLGHSIQSVKTEEPLLIPCKKVKKDRWKPTGIEIAKLKEYFEKNPYSNKYEKLQIIDDLHQNFSSTVKINQLNRWFQNQRERALSFSIKSMCKTIYQKFNQEQIRFLKDSFAKSNYPKLEEMKTMAEKLNVSLSKVENWFKQNRRALAKQGCFTLKSKKYFNEHELLYLEKIFEKDINPSKKRITEITEKLACEKQQVKNWFSNKRRKARFMKKHPLPENFENKSKEETYDFSSQPTFRKESSLHSSQSEQSPESSSHAEESKKINLAPCKKLNPQNTQNVNSLYSQNHNFPPSTILNKTLLIENSSISKDIYKSKELFCRQDSQELRPYMKSVMSGENIGSCPLFQVFTRPIISHNLSIHPLEDDLYKRIQPATFKGFDINHIFVVEQIKPAIAPINNLLRKPFQNTTIIPTSVSLDGSFGWVLNSKSQVFPHNQIPVNYQNRNFYFST